MDDEKQEMAYFAIEIKIPKHLYEQIKFKAKQQASIWNDSVEEICGEITAVRFGPLCEVNDE